MCGQRHASATLPLGKTRYPLYRRLGGPQGRSGRVRKVSLPPGFDPRTVQPIASRYTDCTNPAPYLLRFKIIMFVICQFFPASCCLLLRRFECLPQYLLLEHLQSMIFLISERPAQHQLNFARLDPTAIRFARPCHMTYWISEDETYS